MKNFYRNGEVYRICDNCNHGMEESNSGWYCKKCGNRIKKKMLDRFLYMFGLMSR